MGEGLGVALVPKTALAFDDRVGVGFFVGEGELEVLGVGEGVGVFVGIGVEVFVGVGALVEVGGICVGDGDGVGVGVGVRVGVGVGGELFWAPFVELVSVKNDPDPSGERPIEISEPGFSAY